MANDLFKRWNASLQTKDPILVAAEYTPDGILVRAGGGGGGGGCQHLPPPLLSLGAWLS
jgi:hypothetical protein